MSENVRGQNRGGQQERSEASRDQQRSNAGNQQQATNRRASSTDSRGTEAGRGGTGHGLSPKKFIFTSDYDGQLSDE